MASDSVLRRYSKALACNKGGMTETTNHALPRIQILPLSLPDKLYGSLHLPANSSSNLSSAPHEMKDRPTHRTRGRKQKNSFSKPQEDVAQDYKQQHRRVSSPSSISSQASISSYSSLPSTLSSTSLSSSQPSAIQASRARPCLPQLYEKETFGWQYYRPLNTNPQPFLKEELNLGESRASCPPLSHSLQRCRGSSFSTASISSPNLKSNPDFS